MAPQSERLARRGEENKQNSTQWELKLFHPSLEMPHTNKDTPVAQDDGKDILLQTIFFGLTTQDNNEPQ